MHRVSLFALLISLLMFSSSSWAVETPTSAGPASLVDTPMFRIPKTDTPPTIDGVMEEGEWENASASSSFWYNFPDGYTDFRYLASYETQIQVYAMYDDDYLYVAYTSPVYPESSWFKARGRFPRVQYHPIYGLLWDDHIQFEIRPYHDPSYGFQMGVFRWIINSLAIMDDVFWSPETGWDRSIPGNTRVATTVSRTRWVVEFAVPFEYFAYRAYAGTDESGRPFMMSPPPDGTAYLTWMGRGIGGTGPFFNAYDNHMWNTTKTRLIFDSRSVGFQINELGPIMEDILDMTVTLKNHNIRSESVRLGFFVESADGTIYSSYEDEQTSNGIVELIPGEVRRLRLRKAFPGITEMGNILWFDVRTAGRPAKSLYLTRLVNFHSQDAVFFDQGRQMTHRERRVEHIQNLRPPKIDFEIINQFWPYNNNMVTIVDRGLHGASDESQRASEARVAVVDPNTQEELAHNIATFHDDFAVSEFIIPELEDDKEYSVSVILFDENQRIVGEDDTRTITKWGLPVRYTKPPEHLSKNAQFTPIEKWFRNELGLQDTVWEPFTPLERTANGFNTLKHEYTLTAAGLPSQIYIKPHERKLRLEARTSIDGKSTAFPAPDPPGTQALLEVGRGAQLRAPMRLEAVLDGQPLAPAIVEPAALAREWQSEFEYTSELKLGDIDITLTLQYDCDGSLHGRITYGSQEERLLDRLELVADVAGLVDLVAFGMQSTGMAGSQIWECSLPTYEGVVWDSSAVHRPELTYTHFVPWLFFGSGDRGFTWMADNDRGWGLDKDGSAMTLERNADGEITWRIIFVNHPFNVRGERTINFSILVHPAKPKPDNYRLIAWQYTGVSMRGYAAEPADLTEAYLKRDWYWAAKAPRSIPWEEAANWRRDDPPWNRYGRWRNIGISPALDRIFEEKTVYLLERQIRVGRRHGWWWDEYWPVGYGRSNNIAAGYAYIRDPATVGEKELPWQGGFTDSHMRSTHKRLARIFAENNVPQRQHHWSNAQANTLESFAWDTWLVEECGSDHRSVEVDVVSQHPISNYRFMAKPFLGLVTRVVPGAVGFPPGGDKRLDRQHLGLALLHDIGVSPVGPHGIYRHTEQFMRLAEILENFGFFEDADTEYIPYWRNQHIVRYGEGRKRHAPLIDLSVREPDEQVYISIYRRPIEIDGRSGYKAIFVIMNSFRHDVESDLHILDTKRILGGPNNFTMLDAFGNYKTAFARADSILQGAVVQASGKSVLIDLEDGSVIERVADTDGETYGTVFVPRHDYRLLYGHFLN